MRLYTHTIFSASLIAVSFCFFTRDPLHFTLPLNFQLDAIFFAMLLQYVIDYASHERYVYNGHVYYRRSKLFHSPSGATLLGVSAGLLLYLIASYPGSSLDLTVLFISVTLMLEATFSHLLLDLPTGRGIYVKGKRTWKKQRISSMNPALNTLVVLISLLMLFYYIFNCF